MGVADMVGKRLQLQERIGADIAEILQEILGSEDVAVVIQGIHSCTLSRANPFLSHLIPSPAASAKTDSLEMPPARYKSSW